MEQWQQRVREQAAESLRRRQSRAAARQAAAERRRRGLESRAARKLMRADLDAASLGGD